jgi:hypothetical protein
VPIKKHSGAHRQNIANCYTTSPFSTVLEIFLAKRKEKKWENETCEKVEDMLVIRMGKLMQKNLTAAGGVITEQTKAA